MRGGMFAVMMSAAFLLVAQNAVAQDNDAPCPIYEMRSDIAYFEPQPDSLDADALRVIEAAAAYFLSNQSATGPCFWPFKTISLVGHTDTFGDEAANLKLSRHRAELVAEELVRVGVPRDVISIDAKGETQPAVNTGDNVRELLNNRVTIDPM